MAADRELTGVLETVLYYDQGLGAEVVDFYRELLGLRQIADWPDGAAFRLGAGVLLVFDRQMIAVNDSPVSRHGTTGPGHICFISAPGSYDRIRERLVDAGLQIEHDHEWNGGRRSFYFRDPGANLLEVADSDLWPS